MTLLASQAMNLILSATRVLLPPLVVILQIQRKQANRPKDVHTCNLCWKLLQHIVSCVQKHICQRSDYHGVLVHPERGTHARSMKQTLSKGATCLTKRTPTLPWSSASASCINAVCNMGPSSASCRHPARGAKHANCGKQVDAYRPTVSYTSQPTACSHTFFSTQTAKYQKNTCRHTESSWGPFASRKGNRRHRPQAHE